MNYVENCRKIMHTSFNKGSAASEGVQIITGRHRQKLNNV